MESCHQLRHVCEDLIYTAAVTIANDPSASPLRSDAENSARFGPTFQRQLLDQVVIESKLLDAASVKLSLDQLYQRLIDWSPFEHLQLQHARFLDVLHRVKDNTTHANFSCDYEERRLQIPGAKLNEVASASELGDCVYENSERVRVDFSSGKWSVWNTENGIPVDFWFDGNQYGSVFHYSDHDEAILSDQCDERIDWRGLCYYDSAFRPFCGPKGKCLSVGDVLEGLAAECRAITHQYFRVLEDSEKQLRIVFPEPQWGYVNPANVWTVTLSKTLGYSVVEISSSRYYKESMGERNDAGKDKFDMPIDSKTFFTHHVRIDGIWIPRQITTFHDFKGADAPDDPESIYALDGVQKLVYKVAAININDPNGIDICTKLPDSVRIVEA